MNIAAYVKLFYAFLMRDFYVYGKRMSKYLINYGIIAPVLYVITFAYLQPHVFFESKMAVGLSTFIGNVSQILLSLTYTVISAVLFDLKKHKFTQYQLSILPVKLFIIKEIFFAAIWGFLIVIPFFPLARVLLGSSFSAHSISWPLVFIMLFISALACAAYLFFATSLLKKTEQTRQLWMRVNVPMIILGGFWVPWHVMNAYSPLLGKAVLVNPLIYITEGLRQAIIGGDQFLPLTICIPVLLGFSVVFTLLSFYVFKKKVDAL
ncbi:hypothetical protein Noda2021_09690 [Candidatus Dependentiae bacterium Noda2021]|nr:hypothetical protein Noda2021_09690 [Candidatus Dependentiae bacterium Noda2021]